MFKSYTETGFLKIENTVTKSIQLAGCIHVFSKSLAVTQVDHSDPYHALRRHYYTVYTMHVFVWFF